MWEVQHEVQKDARPLPERPQDSWRRRLVHSPKNIQAQKHAVKGWSARAGEQPNSSGNAAPVDLGVQHDAEREVRHAPAVHPALRKRVQRALQASQAAHLHVTSQAQRTISKRNEMG